MNPETQNRGRGGDVTDIRTLPEPSEAERAHSARLAAQISDEIHACGGVMDFAEFMERALYAPGLGYYTGGLTKFGEAGDFVTAPELSPLFGRCLARQCATVLDATGGAVLEAGAGSGALAAQVLKELDACGALPDTYYILELSPELRARQEEYLRREAPRFAGRVQWLDGLPQSGFRGVVLANELLDAMPVTRFVVREDSVGQLGVGVEGEGFTWKERPAQKAVRERVQALALEPGYVSEINLRAEAWIRSLAEVLEAGLLLIIDYGYPRGEYYHPQRREGTLMCHYRHRAHGDPLVRVGLQDITAHLDFTALAEAGHGAGLEVMGYTSQAAFLLALGLEQMAAGTDANDTRRYLTLTSQIKRLTLPTEMGEVFKVMALGRGIDAPLQGFALQDRRRAL